MHSAQYDIFERYERAELYRLFSGLFLHEPSEEFIFHLKDLFFMTFEDPIDNIRRDFHGLFILNRDLLPVESLQRQDLPRDLIVREVEGFYHSTGIMLDEELSLPPDHLSLELIFLSYTIENGLYETFVKFFDAHIMSWVPQYCDMVKEHSETGFYREALSIFREFLDSEYEELEDHNP